MMEAFPDEEPQLPPTRPERSISDPQVYRHSTPDVPEDESPDLEDPVRSPERSCSAPTRVGSWKPQQRASRSLMRDFSNNVGAFLLSVSTTVQINRNRQGKCIVCLDTFSLKELSALSACPAGDKHLMCHDCASRFFSGRVREGRVDELKCPLYGFDDCCAVATMGELKVYLSEEDIAKYERFKKFAEDPTLRECPVCSECVSPDFTFTEDGGQTVQPAMRCSQGHNFCYYHSNAHPPGPGECEAYTSALAKEQKQAIMATGAKPCPACGIMTVKSDGCNHMVCPSCKAGWCWTCGKSLGSRANTGWHYNPGNPMGCLQFTDSLNDKQMRDYRMILVRLLALPGTLLGLFAFWGVLPLWFLTCCIGLAVSLILLVAVVCAWLPLGFCCVVLLTPLGLSQEHHELLMMAPWLACWSSAECVFGSMEEN